MKYLVTFLFQVICTCAFSQKFDTIQLNTGKPDGLLRIRELNSKGEIRKVWIKNWKENGDVEKRFSQYNANNQKITSIDSLFDKNNNLIKVERKIGNTIEGDIQVYDTKGNLKERSISLYLNDKYIIFQKYYDNEWKYRSIIDGFPPDYIPINPERFDEAVKIYNDRLLIDKIIN